ncbi:MAG: Na/Pi cotransporter family protein [Oscillospiraceae bacterium]|nr:Na/Pi cotransporter family protein [Oscillospiraceae bacterium]MBO5640336.1 Na/Pi cotransporter family protein [Oscillospiraceae bacterium]
MSIPEIFSLLTGVAMFLFGMGLMGDGLKKVSGSKLEPILYQLSGTTLRGVLLGTGVTAVIQSSCATAVMTVGFVNSGMMKVRQGIGVILGAILGTSITGWVICLSYIEGADGVAQLVSTATLTGLVAVVGIGLRMFGNKQVYRHVGDILMGFAVLMVGMSTMSSAVSGLGEADWFINALTRMSNPVVGILVGTLFTALLQSASAAVGIVQALSVTGAMSFEASLPLLMGVAFGASAPVLFSAIGASVEGRRAALVYPVATGFGVLVCACLFYIANAVFRFPFLGQIMNPFSLAAVNSILRFVMILLLLPFTDVIEAVVTALVKDRKEEKGAAAIRLEERFLAYPALAIEQSRLTINEMSQVSEKSLHAALALFSGYSEKGFEQVKALEDDGDRYEDALGTYLIRVTGQEMTEPQNEEVSKYLHTLTDFERISDHALNLAESAKELHEKRLSFSPNAKRELDILFAAVSQIISMTMTAFCEGDLSLAIRVEPLEEVVDELCEQMKLNHVERLQQGVCTIQQGFVFNDIVTNCERVSDHCSNIAVAMIELSRDDFRTHTYVHALQEKGTPEFQEAYEEYARRFAI